MRFALELWTPDPHLAVATARHAEAVGFDAVYLGESPNRLNAETWVTLGAIASSTATIRIGPVITNFLADYRSELLLARQVATLARLADGRVDFRAGAGASASLGRRWWEPAGVRYDDYASRLDALDHGLSRLRRWWGGEMVTAPRGEAVRLDLPHPPIPVTVAASGERAMAVAERHGDCWETSHRTPAEWLTGPRPGRGDMVNSLEIDAFVAPDESSLDDLLRRVQQDRRGESIDRLLDRALVGTPTQVAPAVAAYAAVGVEQLLLVPHDPTDRATLSAIGAIPRPR